MDQEKLGKGAEQVFMEQATEKQQQGHGGQWEDPRVRTGYEQFATISDKGHERKKAGDFNDPFCEAGKPVKTVGHEQVMDKEPEHGVSSESKKEDVLGAPKPLKDDARDEHHSILEGVKDFISHGVEKAKGIFTPSTETSQLKGEKENVEGDKLKGEKEKVEREKRGVEQTH